MSRKFTCFICGHQTLDERCGWDICPVCFWEDDVWVEGDIDDSSPANRSMTVSEAQANYMEMGAIDKRFLDEVRPPREGEERDPEWQPLTKALDIIKNRTGKGSINDIGILDKEN